MFTLGKLLVLVPLFNAQIKHVLSYFVLEMAAITVGTAENSQKKYTKNKMFLNGCIRQDDNYVLCKLWSFSSIKAR